jgi:hypothetical protein
MDTIAWQRIKGENITIALQLLGEFLMLVYTVDI